MNYKATYQTIYGYWYGKKRKSIVVNASNRSDAELLAISAIEVDPKKMKYQIYDIQLKEL